MKIGISCHPTFGGSGVVATELAQALAEGGDEVHVISYAMPVRLSIGGARLFFHPVAVGLYPLLEYPPYSLALATKMVDVVRQHELDLLHVHYAVPNAVSAVLAREILEPYKIRVLTTLHGTDVTLVGNDPSYLETTRFGIMRSDAVTAVSQSLRSATHLTVRPLRCDAHSTSTSSLYMRPLVPKPPPTSPAFTWMRCDATRKIASAKMRRTPCGFCVDVTRE